MITMLKKKSAIQTHLTISAFSNCGSCLSMKQAKTSSQWKVPLWVPIFIMHALLEAGSLLIFLASKSGNGKSMFSIRIFITPHMSELNRPTEKKLGKKSNIGRYYAKNDERGH
jgi:hypothetical protein